LQQKKYGFEKQFRTIKSLVPFRGMIFKFALKPDVKEKGIFTVGEMVFPRKKGNQDRFESLKRISFYI
jgi:hypothetical protein